MPRSPVLDPKYFEPDAGDAGWAAPAVGLSAGSPSPIQRDDVMTVGGTFSATAVLFALLLVGAWFGWTAVDQTTAIGVDDAGQLVEVSTTSIPPWIFPAAIGGLVLVVVGTRKPEWARVAGPVYAIVEGLVLGAISAIYEFAYDGIVLQAVLGTFGVFLTMLAMYGLRIIRVTDTMRKMVGAAIGGVFVMYVAGFVFSLFGADIRFWDEPTPLGIGISFVIVGIAAFNLLLNFDFVEQAAAAGAPKRTEWLAALGLLVGLVWLYLELLRLLSLLRER